jgi:hypothetical protein
VKISGLYKSSVDNQWTWWVTETEYNQAWGTAYEGEKKCYETNIAGDGIFCVNEQTMDRTQLTGTAQFSLRGCTKAAAYSRIKRWFE